MVRNVSKPTYFGSGHMLNSKLVSKPCKQFCFRYKLDPNHDQNFIEHNFRHCKLYIRVHTCITHTCKNRRHIPINTDILGLIFKDELKHKKNRLKNTNIQIREFPACLGSAYKQSVYI